MPDSQTPPFTPGPWGVENMTEDHYFPSVFIGPELSYRDGSGKFRAKIVINEGPTPTDVAAGTGWGTTMETCRANAQLIAAAPSMYETLVEIESSQPKFSTASKLARAVIAHAEGRC